METHGYTEPRPSTCPAAKRFAWRHNLRARYPSSPDIHPYDDPGDFAVSIPAAPTFVSSRNAPSSSGPLTYLAEPRDSIWTSAPVCNPFHTAAERNARDGPGNAVLTSCQRNAKQSNTPRCRPRKLVDKLHASTAIQSQTSRTDWKYRPVPATPKRTAAISGPWSPAALPTPFCRPRPGLAIGRHALWLAAQIRARAQTSGLRVAFDLSSLDRCNV